MLNNFITYAADGAKPANYTGMIVTVVVWAAVFYFLLIRPNKKKQKQHQEMMSSLHAGTQIITAGGIKGEVVSVNDEFVVIRVDKGVNLTMKKSSIANVYSK
ncbi:preprotein translocase subunit YajC [Ilyobacter polytropus]|uniref:Preprotein translocase, YajC subunit n=1 Tax=Ilyobacter polytropus (strain ATCC 51220 / DSM 2926 / LMG 16218 / CuHBu1) TaxID=572544 RepID=E3HA39_ILYPC|nr:preprotein translocase, YajC subunit [Ilyobacter polytropus DSM 2926]